MHLKRTTLFDCIFLFVVFVMGMLSIFSYQRIIDLDQKTDYITQTNLVKLKLEQLLSHIKEAETAQRSYLLTKDSAELSNYLQLVGSHAALLDSLYAVTKDNLTQGQNTKVLRVLVTQRLEKLTSNAGINKDSSVLLRKGLAEGNVLMEKLRSHVRHMNRIEDNLLISRTAQKNYAAAITPVYSLLLTVLAILAVTITYFVFRSENRLRFNAEDNLKKLHEYFKDLPALFSIVKGPGHVHEMANNLYNDVSGHRGLIGKSIKDALPELENQGFYEILDEVYASGEMYVVKEMPFKIDNGKGNSERAFYNFIFQPLFDERNTPEGILIFGYDITELVQSRIKVEEAEQRSRLAIEAANIGTFDWDLENKIFISSDRVMEIFGFTGKAASHQDLINTFHAEDLQKRNKAVEESFEKGSLEYEARIIQPGGDTRWVKVYGKIIHNGMRETLRMYGTVLDTTTQRVILEELIKSEAQFRLLADSMPQFVWTADVHGSLNYFSKAVYDYTGASPGEYDENRWIGIVHPEDRQTNIDKWMNSLTTGDEFIYEHRLKNYKGEYRWYLTRALPQKGSDGIIQRWVGTSTDIQDQKDLSDRLEKQVRERTKELGELNRHLLIKNNIFAQAEENALIGSYSWNLHTSELEYSDNLFRLFGFEPGEFVPTFEKYLSLIHPDDKEQVKKDGEDTLAKKELVAHTYRVITKNGLTRYFRSTGRMIGENENIYLIGTVQDISQDKHYNDMLQSKNLELERSNSELESFNYIASHDLQEPLRKIQAFSQRIISKEDKKFSDFTRDYFNRIQSAAERMQNLIDALLSYSRINASNIPLEKTDLNLLLAEVLNDLQEMVEDSGAVVQAANLPEIKSLAIQVHQVFINLISNAIKYRRPGIPPLITVTASKVAGKNLSEENADAALDYWNISITDNGIGFEQQYEAKIFELFQRLHGSNDYIGTGIGLAICKKIMRNHNGLISAIGRPGQGSTFNIYFPCSID